MQLGVYSNVVVNQVAGISKQPVCVCFLSPMLLFNVDRLNIGNHVLLSRMYSELEHPTVIACVINSLLIESKLKERWVEAVRLCN